VLYLDTSSLLKVFFAEPESDAVDAALAAEDAVIITPLIELEARVQLRARRRGGGLTNAKYLRALERLDSLLASEPFVFRTLTSAVFTTALRQHCDTETHCRSLDRLHLAAMEELELTRLMTHDSRQAEAARAMGFKVATPGLATNAD
jgi:predicted nucleic acid-binding protein